MKNLPLIPIILTVASLLGPALPLTGSCSTAKHQQFDFLVGNWVVRDRSGRVRAALSIAGSANRLRRDVMSSRAATVMRIAAQLSAELGYRPKEDNAQPTRGQGLGG